MARTFSRILCSCALILGCGTAASSSATGGADASVDSGPIGVTATGIAAPTAFACTSASKNAAGFSWQKSPTAGVDGYVVERAALGGDFVAQTPVSSSIFVFADLTVAQAATYRYRVRARVGTALGDTSNEVTVGAPAPGFHTVASAPTGAEATFGTAVDLVLEGNGDPAVIYHNGTSLQFVGWDRRSSAWKSPSKITSGLALGGAGTVAAALGFDSGGVNGTFAVVWAAADGQELDWALSTDAGQTWTQDTIAVSPAGTSYSQPALTIGNGKASIAWLQDGARLFYATGTLSTAPKGWTAKLEAPAAASADKLLPFAPSIALDASLTPAVGYFSHGTNGGVIATFWRPGAANATRIVDSLGFADSAASISLAFSGVKPRAAVTLHDSATTVQPVVFVTSTDGNSWGTALPLPVDGTGGGGLFTRLVTSAKDVSAITWASSAPGGGTCGEPKLALSPDGTTWSTCSPDVDRSRSKSAQFARIALGSDGKRWLAWQDPNAGGGVLVWRED